MCQRELVNEGFLIGSEVLLGHGTAPQRSGRRAAASAQGAGKWGHSSFPSKRGRGSVVERQRVKKDGLPSLTLGRARVLTQA